MHSHTQLSLLPLEEPDILLLGQQDSLRLEEQDTLPLEQQDLLLLKQQSCILLLEQEDFPQLSTQGEELIILNYSFINRGAGN